MANQFLHFGYFITKPIFKPEYIKINSKFLLTASNCICNIMPDFFSLFPRDKKTIAPDMYLIFETINKQKRAKFTKTQLKELILLGNDLLKQNKLILSNFLTDYHDAVNIKGKYLPDYDIYSLAIEKEFSMTLIKDVYSLKLDTPKTDGIFCGYDILGTEGGGFHTYLCNGLEEDIQKRYELKTNEYGLINNDYEDVVKFAKLIEGEGEPVTWLPYAVYKH